MESQAGALEFGQLFSRLMANAIKTEEEELRRLKVQGANDNVTQVSVRFYAESWFWPAFLKQAFQEPACPKLDWEKERIDCCFLDKDQRLIAQFELKPLFPAPGPGTFVKIVDDFGKQAKRSKESPAVAQYVVLVPWGTREAISDWRRQELLPAIKTRYPAVQVTQLPDSDSIQLNSGTDDWAVVQTFRVASAA